MLRCREYGPNDGTPTVVVVHGGPGAPGSAGGLAHALARPAHVLEPWQEARTVDEHVADLAQVIAARCDGPPVLVGHSWGAMLALAFAAAHPTAALCLVGSGTFDLDARAEFRRRLAIGSAYDVDPLPADPLDESDYDARAGEASWNDMLRLQADGTYPASFAGIRVPVLMIHGAQDPHPGALIRASLAPVLPQLDYRELAACGHYPWRERAARDEFLQLVRAWLGAL
jgi:pimeloyl-ACP methyl ester carboxylesterase